MAGWIAKLARNSVLTLINPPKVCIILTRYLYHRFQPIKYRTLLLILTVFSLFPPTLVVVLFLSNTVPI
jgi:hypothetical protein